MIYAISMLHYNVVMQQFWVQHLHLTGVKFAATSQVDQLHDQQNFINFKQFEDELETAWVALKTVLSGSYVTLAHALKLAIYFIFLCS